MSPHSSQTGREIILQCQEKAPTTVFSLLNKSCETSRIFIDKSTDRSTIHTHLCWCLLLAHLVLLLGLDATSLYPLCYAVAVTLHFLFLAAFSWMLAEGYSCQRTYAKCLDKAPTRAFSFLKAPTALSHLINY